MAAVWRSQRVFTRIFHGKTKQILNNAIDIGAKLTPSSQSIPVSNPYSSYRTSEFIEKIDQKYDYEIIKNPPEWKFVQRLLPFESVPQITFKETYPSGWIPPKEEAKDQPYFIARTKNYQLPIYLKVGSRGMTKTSLIKKIEGDIWLMNDEIKAYLKQKNKKYIETRVHELARFIEVKGDFVSDCIDWAHSKGF